MAAPGPKQGPLIAPLLLRVALGATFIWAGLGKLVPTVDFSPQDAAILANLGTGIVPSHPNRATSPNDTTPKGPALSPPATLPLPDVPVQNAPTPGTGKPTSSGKAKPAGRQNRASIDATAEVRSPVLGALTVDDLPAVAGADRKLASAKTRNQPSTPATGAQPPANTTPPKAPASVETLPPGGKYSAADFSEPARARRAYSLAVLMVRAAYPQPTPAQPAPKSYWPKTFADSPWVIWLSFGAAVIELFAGVLIMVGFLTRLSSIMVVLLMFTAMWLTQLGPAMSMGQTQFGFLPDKVWWDPAAWSTFFWQLLLIVSSISLACLGAGALSVDRALAVIGSGGPKTEQEPPAKP